MQVSPMKCSCPSQSLHISQLVCTRAWKYKKCTYKYKSTRGIWVSWHYNKHKKHFWCYFYILNYFNLWFLSWSKFPESLQTSPLENKLSAQVNNGGKKCKPGRNVLWRNISLDEFKLWFTNGFTLLCSIPFLTLLLSSLEKKEQDAESSLSDQLKKKKSYSQLEDRAKPE